MWTSTTASVSYAAERGGTTTLVENRQKKQTRRRRHDDTLKASGIAGFDFEVSIVEATDLDIKNQGTLNTLAGTITLLECAPKDDVYPLHECFPRDAVCARIFSRRA